MQDIKAELLILLKRNDLLGASLLLGKIPDAGFDESKYREMVMELAAKVWYRAVKAKHAPVLKAHSINEILYQDFGVEGRPEGYKKLIDDPRQFLLHELLERKTGSPLALCTLYKIIADQVGLECTCYALPTYYYLKVNDADGNFYIDPFDRGKLFSEEEFQRKLKQTIKKALSFSISLFERIEHHQLVGRVAQRLKQIYILKGKALDALRAVELLTILYPNSPEYTRDRGILYCEVEYFSKAMEDLKNYLSRCPDAEDVREIKKLTSMLRGYQEIIN